MLRARGHVHLAYSACASRPMRALSLSLFPQPLHFLSPLRLRLFNNNDDNEDEYRYTMRRVAKKQYNARSPYCVFVAAFE